MLVNNTGEDIRAFTAAIRAVADGTADADTREALDIFEIRVLEGRIIVDFAPDEEPG
jgi:hypothetical protein